MIVEQEVNEPLSQSVSKDTKNIKIDRKKQYIAAIAVSLGGFCAGTVLAWTSPANEYLLENESQKNNTFQSSDLPGFKISTSEEAVVGAILNIGALVFAIPSGKCADLIGRKLILILSAICYLVNFVIIGFAKNVQSLIVARLFAGMGLGAACVVSPIYIGEIADDSVRGILGSFFNVLLGLGILYTTVIGAISNWIGLTVALCLFPVGFGISVLFLPETPIYLVAAEKLEKAKRSLLFFRNDEAIAYEEFIHLQKRALDNNKSGTISDFFTKKRYRKSLIAGVGVFAFQQLCGINVVVFYMVPIFRAAGSSLNPALAAITSNLVVCIVGVISVFIIEKRNRKYFLTLSAFSMMVGATILGFFFQLKKLEIDFIGLKFLPISSVVLFVAGFVIGYGPVPWILITELYQHEIRGIASGVVIVVNWLCAFVVTLSYPVLMQSVGNYLTFYLYGISNLLGIIFIRFMVPETKIQAASTY